MTKIATNNDLTEQVGRIFRMNGYRGSTMSIISEQTGLGRSSLYHYFGNGKSEMAHRSLDAIEAFIQTVRETARDAHMSPQRKWQAIEAMLRNHYQGGLLGCLLAVFALEDVPGELRERTKRLFESWIDAAAELYAADGITQKLARTFAQRDITLIQGALILSQAIRSPAPFDQTMHNISQAIGERTSSLWSNSGGNTPTERL